MGDKYKKVELIGSGTFGRVWLVLAKRSHRKYAIKEIQVSGMSSRDKDQALTEVTALGRCKHVNIIRYKEAFVDRGMLNIAMEYADGGDLHSKVKSQKGVYLPEQVVLDWYTQIAFGLRYIHGRNILHRDLKSQNIFLSKNGTIKIGDFGIAKIMEGTTDHATTAIGTPYYLSPEICQRKPYNHKSDVWASGCVFYELVCLRHPFDGVNFSDLVLKIMQGRYKSIPSHYSALVEDLISILLRIDATKRPSARQILCIPVMQPNVDAYVTRMHHLHGSICGSIATMSMLEKKKPSPPPKADKGLTADDEKENVSPQTCTLAHGKPSRKHSLRTPKAEALKEKRSNSAECIQNPRQNKYPIQLPWEHTAELLIQRYVLHNHTYHCQIIVKNSPKYSLYMDIVNRKMNENSPTLRRIDGKSKKDSKPEPRLSLSKMVKERKGESKKERRQSKGADDVFRQASPRADIEGAGMDLELRQIGSHSKQNRNSRHDGFCETESQESPTSVCSRSRREGGSDVCSKTYNVDKGLSDVSSGFEDLTISETTIQNDTVIFREKGSPSVKKSTIKLLHKITPGEVTALLHQHAIHGPDCLLQQAEGLRYCLETLMGCDAFMEAYQILRQAVSERTPFEEFTAKFSAYKDYHPLVFWLVQLEVAAEFK